jgi:hypothetical protein
LPGPNTGQGFCSLNSLLLHKAYDKEGKTIIPFYREGN